MPPAHPTGTPVYVVVIVPRPFIPCHGTFGWHSESEEVYDVHSGVHDWVNTEGFEGFPVHPDGMYPEIVRVCLPSGGHGSGIQSV